MSQPTQQSQADQLDNAAGAILGVIIVIIFILIASDRRPVTPQAQDSPPEVAVSVPTATPLPVETSVPATATRLPTSTPVPPTITPSPLPPTPVPTEMPPDAPTTAPTEEATSEQADTSNGEYDPLVVLLGEAEYIQCAACHGQDARGITGLGKDLVDSEFVHSLSDEELVDFIKTGRPIWDANNTTGLDMPPKGGNPALTDEDIFAIVAYLRSLSGDTASIVPQDDNTTDTVSPKASPMPPTPTAIPTESPTTEPTDIPVTESTDTSTENTDTDVNDGEYDPLMVLLGEAEYIQCAACHGQDARGITGLGKDLVDSEFVHSLSDEELVDFIKTGRPIWDANNTTGLDMPPKGGNPALTDEDIFAIVAYLRSLSDDPNSD